MKKSTITKNNDFTLAGNCGVRVMAYFWDKKPGENQVIDYQISGGHFMHNFRNNPGAAAWWLSTYFGNSGIQEEIRKKIERLKDTDEFTITPSVKINVDISEIKPGWKRRL